jgi:hypothetical protein
MPKYGIDGLDKLPGYISQRIEKDRPGQKRRELAIRQKGGYPTAVGTYHAEAHSQAAAFDQRLYVLDAPFLSVHEKTLIIKASPAQRALL